MEEEEDRRLFLPEAGGKTPPYKWRRERRSLLAGRNGSSQRSTPTP